MSLREKLASLLRSPKAKEPAGQAEPRTEDRMVDEAPPVVPLGVLDEAMLELASDHPIYALCSHRQREAGFLPSPRLCLDEDGVLSKETLLRERNRVQSALTRACLARMKDVEGRRGSKKPKDEEDEGPMPLDARPAFFLSSDKLYAWMIVFPPARQGWEISRDLLEQELEEEGITYGVDTQLVNRISRGEHQYFNMYLIARGTPAFDGKNGNIIDRFPRVIERVLQVDEYDQVDYAALNLIHNAEQGQEICRLIEPTEGEPGRTVTDEEIPARGGKAVALPKGRNTEISEDGLSLLASIAGHVEFTGHSFQVKPVMDIPGNVDFSTGNINFLGDVNVRGSVLSGFTVRAMGNIRIEGVIEAGSTVEAGGDLVVVKGILGDGSTIVRSQRCIFSKYVENSTIYVRENLQTDCVINGSVYCDGEVQVRSGKGSIMGGRVWAAKLISAVSVGSLSECRTVVSLGGQPCAHFEREQGLQELRELEMEIEKLECQPDSPIKFNLLGKARMKFSAAELKLRHMDSGLVNVSASPEEADGGRLECGVVYPGAEINFGRETVRIQTEQRQCVAKMCKGEILLM